MLPYEGNSRGRCPYCLTTVRFERATISGGDKWLEVISAEIWHRQAMLEGRKTEDFEKVPFNAVYCPECGGMILTINKRDDDGNLEQHVVWPIHSSRPVQKEVPPHIAEDYKEAASVLNLSPKASAALSRRCLQTVLREAGEATQNRLVDQIDAVMPNLPSYIADNIDAPRKTGNFAAHLERDKSSGEIVDVDPGEAEWNLDILDQLFDFYYVQPERAKQKREALNAKLKATGKPPMK